MEFLTRALELVKTEGEHYRQSTLPVLRKTVFVLPFGPCFLRYREGYDKSGVLPRYTLYSDIATVPGDNLPPNRESDADSAVSGVSAVEPLEWLKDFLVITLIETKPLSSMVTWQVAPSILP